MSLYVERDTSLLYEVQLFEDFAIVRPATPGFEQAMEKLNHADLGTRFDEYSGIQEQVYEHMSQGELAEGGGIMTERKSG